MNKNRLKRYLTVTALFLALALLESKITNPAPTPKALEYRAYYLEQAKKADKQSLTEQEFETLTEREKEYVEALAEQSQDQFNELLLRKLVFAGLLSIASFLSCKYVLKGVPGLLGPLFTVIACMLSIVWFVSPFVLSIYLAFTLLGALIGYKYNKANPTDRLRVG